MVNSINGSPTSFANEAVKPAAPKPQPQPQQAQQQTASQPSDTVTLKSTGNAGQTATSNNHS